MTGELRPVGSSRVAARIAQLSSVLEPHQSTAEVAAYFDLLRSHAATA